MINKLKLKIDSDAHLKEILSGSAVTFILKMTGLTLSYIVALIISHRYGAEGIGIYNLTLSIITFMAMIASMGINVSILRYVGQFNKTGENHKLKLLYRYASELIFPFSILLSILLYSFSDAIAYSLFDNPLYKPALEFSAIIIPFMVMQNVSVEFIRGFKKIKVSEFLRSVNRPLINIVLIFILGLFWTNQMIPIYSVGIGVVVSAVLAIYYVLKHVKKFKYNPNDDFTKKELIATSVPMMISQTSTFMMSNISLIMLEFFSTTKDVGVFSIALKLSALVSLVLLVVNTISAPKFSELYWKNKHKELQSVMLHSAKIVYIFSFSMIIFFSIFSEFSLGLFGPEFILGKYVLIMLMFGELVNAITGPVGVFMNMIGKQMVLKNISLISLFVTFICSLLLIPGYGTYGAAISLIFGMVLKNIFLAIYIRKEINIVTYYLPFSNRK